MDIDKNITSTDEELEKTSRIKRELIYQSAKASEINVSATPSQVLKRYQLNRNWKIYPKEYIYRMMGNLNGKRVLDFGCGTGEITTQLASLGGQVLAIDLSEELVTHARQRAILDKVDHCVEFLVGDGETVELPKNAFDLIMVYGVLHHVVIPPVISQLHDSLKPGGTVYICEPVCYSSALKFIRNLVPMGKDKSPDERPLNTSETDQVMSAFRTSTIMYFEFLARLERFAPSLQLESPGVMNRLFKFASRVTRNVDRLILAVPGAWRLASVVVISGTK